MASPVLLAAGALGIIALLAGAASASESPKPGRVPGPLPPANLLSDPSYSRLTDAEKVAYLTKKGYPLSSDPALEARVRAAGGLVQSPAAEKSTQTAPEEPVMSKAQQDAFVAALRALTVDSEGNILGPVTADAIRLATQTSGRLEKDGFPEAAQTLRKFAQLAAEWVAPPEPKDEIPMPPSMPAELAKKVQRFLQNERDPAKIQKLVDALREYKNTPEGKNAIQMLKALMVQIESEEAKREALEKAQEVIETPVSKPLPEKSWRVDANSRVVFVLAPDSGVTAEQVILAVQKKVPDVANIKKSGKNVSITVFNDDAKPFTVKESFIRNEFGVPATIISVKPFVMPAEVLPEPAPAKVVVPPAPVPQPPPPPKSPALVAAEAMNSHLRAIQSQYGMPGAKGKENVNLIMAFQKLAGLKQDGQAGPGTLAKGATFGATQLPLVMYWPVGSNRSSVQTYRDAIRRFADEVDAQGLPHVANELRMAANYEKGQGGVAEYGPALV